MDKTSKGTLYFKRSNGERVKLEDNLTMEEIADNNGVSKNAVSKSLIEVKDKLEEYENILKLYHNKQRILELLEQEEIDKIIDLI